VKNAVAVLVILLAISVVLALAYLGLNAANKGQENLGNTTTQMDQRRFEPYKNKTMTGAAVKAAIQNFQNQPVGVYVHTNKADNVTAGAFMLYAAYITMGDETPPGADADVDLRANWGQHTFTTTEVRGMSSVASGEAGYADRIVLDAARTLYPDVQNTNTTEAIRKASPYYINDTAKFYSCLVYDENGEIIGVAIEQISGTRPETGTISIIPQ